jgi:hypothetical protein
LPKKLVATKKKVLNLKPKPIAKPEPVQQVEEPQEEKAEIAEPTVGPSVYPGTEEVVAQGPEKP